MRSAIAIAALLALTVPAQAQKLTPPKLPIDPLGLNQKQAAAPSAPGLSSINFEELGAQIQKVAKELVDKGIADLQAASTDAKNRNDQIAQPCWDAQVAFLQLLPVEWPTPPTDMGPALTIQVSRDLLNSITGNDKTSLKVACAALLGDQISIISNVVAMVGLKAGLAAVGVP